MLIRQIVFGVTALLIVNSVHAECTKDSYRCSNGKCIPKFLVCDMQKDCTDGSDEANCTTTTYTRNVCGSKPFVCTNNPKGCIPRSWRCDGMADCTDSSDEVGCVYACEAWQFKCKNNRCILNTYFCDGTNDCGDNSDEDTCQGRPSSPLIPTTAVLQTSPKEKVKCSPHEHQCPNGKCIPYNLEHTRKSLEAACSTEAVTYPPKRCPTDQFSCTNGDCIRNSKVCDGTPDCKQAEDEHNCKAKNSCDPTRNETQFKCLTTEYQRCIPLSQHCDGVFQCHDFSDETNCAGPRPTASPDLYRQALLSTRDQDRIATDGRKPYVEEALPEETEESKHLTTAQLLRKYLIQHIKFNSTVNPLLKTKS